MAEYLASIFGTEKDKVNCSFYFKIGACRHGDRCSRLHNKPAFSTTILIANMYQNPTHITGNTLTEEQLQLHFEQFFEDVFTELAVNYGEVEEMYVCDNIGDHLIGNVYVRFRYEEDAQKAVDGLNNRFYAGRPLFAELSPVSDFREACCRQYEKNECTRGGFCNFMHLKVLGKRIKHELYAYEEGRAGGRRTTSSYSPGRARGEGAGGGFGGGFGGGRDRSRSPPGRFGGGGGGFRGRGGGSPGFDDRYGGRPPPQRGMYDSPRGGGGGGYDARDRGGDRGGYDRGGDRGGYDRGGDRGGYDRGGYRSGGGGDRSGAEYQPDPSADPHAARARIPDERARIHDDRERYGPAPPPGDHHGGGYYGPVPPPTADAAYH